MKTPVRRGLRGGAHEKGRRPYGPLPSPAAAPLSDAARLYFVGRRGRVCDTRLRAPRRAAATPDFTYFKSTMLRDSTPSSWARR